jgi:hypothetical protein
MPETRTARLGLNVDGTVVVRIRPGAIQTLQDARENLAEAIAATGGQRRPLLIDIRGAQPLGADARHQYSGTALDDSFVALAMLIDGSPLSTMMGNVYLRIARPGIPARLFTEETRAIEWLTRQRLA